MSKLEQLISELCPDGVEYKDLENCCKILDNKRKPVTKSARQSGEYPYYGANGIQDYVSDYIFDGTYVLVGEDGSVVTKNGTPVVTWATGKIWVNNHAHIIEEIEGILLRYLFYYIQTINISSLIHGNIPKLTGKDFKSLQIPIPPLPVQEEIIRILDKFTELTAELTAELAREIEAHKKQLEYYREQLIQRSEKSIKLSKICDIYLGLTSTPNYVDSGVKFISAQNTSSDFLNFENVKYISESDYEKATSNAKPQRGDLLFTRVGSNLGHPVIVDTDEKLCIFVSLGFLRIKDENIVINRYLKHWMNTKLFWDQVSKNVYGAAKVNLNTGWLKEFNIPLPSINKQIELCDKLDQLDKICTGFLDSLSDEIEVRKKQYEYYRDKLLTFPKADIEV